MNRLQKSISQYLHLIKEGSWVLTNQVLSAIISLIGLRIITELLDAKYLGTATLWLGILFLIRNIIISPISLAQSRFHPEYIYNNNILIFNRTITNIYIKRVIFSSIVFLIIAITYSIFYDKKFNNTFIISILVLYLFIDTFKNYKLNQIISERKQAYAAQWNIFETFLTYFLIYIFLKIHADTGTYLAGQTIAILITTLTFGLVFFPLSNIIELNHLTETNGITLQKIKKYSKPLIPIAILGWVNNLGDRYIIGSYLSLTEVGLYVAAYSISSRAFIIPNGIISGFFKPILFQAESKKQLVKSKLIFKFWILCVIIISSILLCIFYFWGAFIAEIFLAKAYRELAPELFIWIGLGYSFQAIYQAIENRLYSYFESSKVLIPTIIGAVTNILLNVTLLPILGILGAAITTALSFLFQTIAIFISFIQKRSILIKKSNDE